MKKVVIASIAGLLMQVSMLDAQTRPNPDASEKKLHVQPPPPPPPPPPAPQIVNMMAQAIIPAFRMESLLQIQITHISMEVWA